MSKLAPKCMPTFLCNIYHLEMLTKILNEKQLRNPAGKFTRTATDSLFNLKLNFASDLCVQLSSAL